MIIWGLGGGGGGGRVEEELYLIIGKAHQFGRIIAAYQEWVWWTSYSRTAAVWCR